MCVCCLSNIQLERGKQFVFIIRIQNKEWKKVKKSAMTLKLSCTTAQSRGIGTEYVDAKLLIVHWMNQSTPTSNEQKMC